jgi:16S rRNA (cytosine1402-N4)-methyltransferase
MQHFPVLLKESLEYLNLRPDGVYVDCTSGLGGHTGALARRLTSGRLIALDRDSDSLEIARTNTLDCADRITFRQASFSQLETMLASLGVLLVDGILADLGVSLYQLTDAQRGFSLQRNGPLDMRMDRSQELTAADLVNRCSERELSDLFFHLGEERRAGRVARAILRARPIRDTRHLAEVVSSAVPRQGKLHPATLVFQALRMAVNEEPAELDALLEAAPRCIKPGGRLVVIAFQSLDDRKVKLRFRELGKQGRARILTKHVVKPGEEETRQNPPSRSAVLRAAEISGENLR